MIPSVVMVPLLNNRIVTKTEVDTREWGVAVTGLTMLPVGSTTRLEKWLNSVRGFNVHMSMIREGSS